MVAEIKDAGEPGAGELAFIPGAVVVLRLGKVAHAAEHGRMIGHAGGDQAEHGPSGLRRGGLPLAAEFGLLIGIGRLAPAAVGLLMGQEPLGPGHHGRIVLGHADLDQAGQGLPGAVDVVDAPAAEPASVGLLGAAHERDGPIDVRIAHAAAEFAQGLQHPAAKVGRAGIDHGVVIGERHIAEEVAIVVAVERAPTAVAILHGQHPPQAALDRSDRVLQPDACPPLAVRLDDGFPLRRGRGFAGPSATWPCRRRPG